MAPPSKYSPEFREEAVQIALRSSKTISEVARELELNSETLRGWVKKYQKQQEPAPDAELTVNERARLKELERRNRELEMEVTFLKKAAVRSMGRCNIPGRTATGGVAGWRGSGVRGCRTSRSVKCGGDGVTGSR
ncbi:transposase [Streptomyces sp. NBC_01384]|uniref:transposase n=1 Tax=Streptomyces sp. NBC_01384 TaxID=2903847 RepID=UPI003251A5D9